MITLLALLLAVFFFLSMVAEPEHWLGRFFDFLRDVKIQNH